MPQEIQQAQYPIEQLKSVPKCPLGHTAESQQGYEANDQQKLLQNLNALLQYQSQEQDKQQKQQEFQYSYQQSKNIEQQKYQALYQQLKNTEQQKYQAVYQQLNNAYQQSSNAYQQSNNAYQQKGYQASYQNVNNGYLPPQVSNDIYQTAYQASEKDSQKSISSSQIRQELSSSSNVQNEYESLRQQYNNAHITSQIQQQQLLNANIQKNENVKTELSQEHQGKIKQTINYDISHQQQGYNQHQGHLNAYNDAKSSTNIERHHDIHHNSEGNDEHSEEIDHESGKHKKDHDAYYKFEYAVNDQHTGDIKRQKEERSGDEVRGEYSLVEKDGNVRTVKYFADWKTGFHATVHNSKPRN